ncbi:DUF1566 domain-containing protein [Pseudomarimonas arenosa]|uniref:DUF1566 domain-containing protein n=1 Tax=Pseudomarimonas arenosa TaxID=2774145 RepID=A0AAW3ZDT8_9GAMM|nr:DUF1566 domain-containing protein [Pseudomarimonas arenosa]MBD8524341.1 DUF1566 domain-containing protein [Pseudomarimonas arenosa]
MIGHCGRIALWLALSGTSWANCSLISGNLEAAPDSRYALSEPVSGQPIVTDLQTGLQWQRCTLGLSGSDCDSGSASLLDWSAALSAADTNEHAGFTDWRLPNAHELQSLVEYGCHAPAINSSLFPATDSARYWTSTTSVTTPASAWTVDFTSGLREFGAKSTSRRLRLVRAGTGLASFDAGANYTPDAFTLTPQSAVAAGSTVTSNSVVVTGIDTPTGIKVEGETASYRVNGGVFVSSNGVVHPGDEVEVRHTAAASAGQQRSSTLTIGGITASFRSTTASDNALLTSLEFSGLALAPTFDSSTLSYSASVPFESDATAVTAGSADANASMTLNAAPLLQLTTSAPLTLAVGDNTFALQVTAEDGVTRRSYITTIQRAKQISSVSISGSPNPALPAQQVTITAQLSGAAPSGNLMFKIGDNAIAGCEAVALTGSGDTRQAICASSALPSGNLQIHAEYLGDDNNQASSDMYDQLVNTPPQVVADSSVQLLEDGSLQVAFQVSDPESVAEQIGVTLGSDNATLFDDAVLNASLSGSSSTRSFRLTPIADAFGAATIIVTASDPMGSSVQHLISVQVLPVNDAPSSQIQTHAQFAAGSSGLQSLTGFATQLSPGPSNEAAQTLDFAILQLVDREGILNSVSLDASGTLWVDLSGRSGVAVLSLQTRDDGGTSNGGEDRQTAQTARIFVGDAADLTVTITRKTPAAAYLPDALDLGQTLAEFELTLHNHGPVATEARLDSELVRGLSDPLWSCDSAGCSPGSGNAAPAVNVPLAPEQSAVLELSGQLQDSHPWLELRTRVRAVPGPAALGAENDRDTLIEPLQRSAVFYTGLE